MLGLRSSFVGAVANHLDAGVHEEQSEHEQQPPELVDQRTASEHKYGAQRECPKDSPEQHAVLVLDRDCHCGKEHRPHEHVVDTERLFDEVAADVFAEGMAAEADRDGRAECQAAGDPYR